MREKNLVISIVINIGITIVEVIVGLSIGSLAIISDAVHNFFDVGAMFMSLFGEKASSKKIDTKHSYGYKRAEILIALLNSVFLLVSIVFISYEAIKRLVNPQPIEGSWMLVMAVVAFGGNMIATKLLHDHADESMNMKSAFLHSLQDALFSAGVIVASIFVLFLDRQWADAVISLILSILLAKEAIVLFLETVHVLMEGVPASINIETLKNDLLSIAGVYSVEDLHVWKTGSKEILLTAHISVHDLSSDFAYAEKLTQIKQKLLSTYKINHSTIQLVPVGVSKQFKKSCKHCN